jgi:antitoxin (DNA-binding transcriptional repressor) of toxin-antitoxin stability system
MEPKLAGRQITMMLSPLPEHARQRRFKLSHGKLIEEDDFDEEEEDSAAEASESVKEEAES